LLNNFKILNLLDGLKLMDIVRFRTLVVAITNKI